MAVYGVISSRFVIKLICFWSFFIIETWYYWVLRFKIHNFITVLTYLSFVESVSNMTINVLYFVLKKNLTLGCQFLSQATGWLLFEFCKSCLKYLHNYSLSWPSVYIPILICTISINFCFCEPERPTLT